MEWLAERIFLAKFDLFSFFLQIPCKYSKKRIYDTLPSLKFKMKPFFGEPVHEVLLK